MDQRFDFAPFSIVMDLPLEENRLIRPESFWLSIANGQIFPVHFITILLLLILSLRFIWQLIVCEELIFFLKVDGFLLAVTFKCDNGGAY